MKKLLICGSHSYVATGLEDALNLSNVTYDCFSRGEEKRIGNVVTGDVMNMANSSCLNDYDTVVNFIIIKNADIETNIRYIKSLLNFCRDRGVKRLIQISSISVYPNNVKYVNEKSVIETDYNNKGGYASVKVAVDHYLLDKTPKDIDIVFVRPGFVYSKDHDVQPSGIFIKTPIGKVLLGDKKTSLPLISKKKLHEALVEIIKCTAPKSVYLILNKDQASGTKYNFVKQQWGGCIFYIPSTMFTFMAAIFNKLCLLPDKYYSKVLGLFKRTWFDSTNSERDLRLYFGKEEFAVIGSGAYGSYVTNALSVKYPHEHIEVIEVGDNHLKNESEIGYRSKITNASYNGLTKGRFFGFGGATVKWGGQLFTFSENDFAATSKFMSGVVALNVKYRERVLSRFNLCNDFVERQISNKLFLKSGIWLSYFHRNLFKYFRIAERHNVSLMPNSRVTKLIRKEDNSIESVEYICDGKVKVAKYDHYFLAAGAFESSRILINSDFVSKKELQFSDHLSQKVFKIKSGTSIGDVDLCFDIKGASLVTKRFVGEYNGVSYFCHPIFNQDFPFFQNFKRLLFNKSINSGVILNIIKDIPSCIAFAYTVLIKKRMYVYNNEYYLQLDIENPTSHGKIKLSDDLDKYKEKGLVVDFRVDETTSEIFKNVKLTIQELLDSNHIEYEEVNDKTCVDKYEDTYHPFGSFCDFESVDDYFNRYSNLLIMNSAILQRAGGINSTCAVMPLIEEYVDNIMK